MADITILTHEYPPFRGGIGTYTAEVARAAADQGHTVTVYAPDYGKPRPATHPAPRFTERFFPATTFRPSKLPALLLFTLRIALANRKTLLFGADWPFVVTLALIAKALPIRYEVMLHGSEILFLKNSRAMRLLGLANPFARARHIYANSQYTADLLFKHYPQIPASRVTVTHLGVNTFWFGKTPVAQAKRLAKTLKLDARPLTLLTVGRIHPRKGQQAVLEALQTLPAKLKKQVQYVIVGQTDKPDYQAQLQALAKASGIRTVFAGALENDDVRALYAAADLFVLPASIHDNKVEGFGLVFLEAAASGLPTLSTTSGAVPEVVRHRKTGWLTPPNDTPALAAALQTLLTDNPLRKKLGAAALAWSKTFTWARCAKLTFGA